MIRRALLALALALAAAPAGAWLLEDPTRPAGYEPPRAPAPAAVVRAPVEWRLTFIRVGAAGAHAVLNGETVRVGDALGDARVLEIRADAVVLDEAGARREVSLVPSTDRVREQAPAAPADGDRQARVSR